MRNIWKIICNDAHHICHSVVAIVIIMGLSIVPCLYAWFNIFSNWAPYGTDATSRISVSVVSCDKGAEIFGKEMNIGDQVISALEANTQIGWVFCDTQEEALELVYSSDCYAALVVPEDFSENIVSFIGLEFKHPELIYYENGKKNAIAPKITGQAKNAVQQQVNATFLQTIVSSASEIISVLNANGIDPETALKDLSSSVSDLNTKLDDCAFILVSLADLTGATENLLLASSTLVMDMSVSMGLSSDLAGSIGGNISQAGGSLQNVLDQIMANMGLMQQNMNSVSGNMSAAAEDPQAYNSFVESSAAESAGLEAQMQQSAQQIADSSSALGYSSVALEMSKAARQLGELSQMTNALTPADPNDPEQWEQSQEAMQQAAEKAGEVEQSIQGAINAGQSVQLPTLEDNFNQISASVETMSQLLDAMQVKVYNLSVTLHNLANTLATLRSGIYETLNAVNTAREQINELAEFLDALAESEFFKDVIAILSEGTDVLDSHIASPIKVSDQIMFATEEHYGSQMAPFYTMLAQWVGALFCAVLLKTPIRREDAPLGMTVPQHYLGRYALFLFVGIAQALIVSLGDLWYVDIVCAHPGLFVLSAVVAGICFVTINYMLVYTLGAAGLAASVIVMLVQVAGAGGTFPVEVLPAVFGKIYPFMPFKFGMNAMREAVCGLYQDYYLKNILVLIGITAATFPIAFIIYRPAKLLNDILEKAKKQSKIMT